VHGVNVYYVCGVCVCVFSCVLCRLRYPSIVCVCVCVCVCVGVGVCVRVCELVMSIL
jgi:hypothetical protein